MKVAAVLTYPGHFLMTCLCLRSIRTWWPDIKMIYVLYDDLADSWPSYQQDCEQFYSAEFKNIKLIPYSSLSGLAECWVGWWRAQLIKLHADQILPGDEWFVVDGDVLFDERCDLTGVTPYSPWIDQRDRMLDLMVGRYVDHMLGGQDLRVSVPEYDTVITSIIPFRWLDREQLTSLRDHVCRATNQSNMLEYHVSLFRSQGIVGYVPEGDRMVMHEWELIEAWNHIHRPNQYQLVMTGSGYQIQTHTAGLHGPRFRHSSSQDKEIGREWFRHQNISVPDDLWTKIMDA